MSPYLDRPPETMWQAASRLMREAEAARDLGKWDRALRLWWQANLSQAPGIPFNITTWNVPWLP